jgi:hypothetical protein
MNFYDVLAAEKWDGGIPTINFFDLLFAQSISGEQWQIYEGTLPATINANGSDLRQYQIWGNTGGVGDKTENLFEVESNMLSSLNWGENPKMNNIVYFINYKLSNAVIQELKKGIHTCSIFEHFTDGYTPNLLVCAFVPTLVNTIDETYRILTNQGVTFAKTFDFSEWQDIYLIIGYGNGFRTNAEKQLKIDELFTNWRISIVEGTTAPASFVPYGYEVDIGVKSANLFDTNRQGIDTFVLDSTKYIVGAIANGPRTRPEEITEFAYNNDSFTILSTSGIGIGFLVKVKPDTTYTVSYQCDVTITDERSSSAINLITSTGDFGQFWAVYGKSRESTFTTKADTAYVYVVFRAVNLIATYSNIMLNEGSTALPYEPYSNTTTPIYIGNDPLDKDEYVDYQAGKIYRMIDGTLTPTDPPVTLPALPTAEGETVVDYEGQSVAPEKVLLEYAKGGN